MLNTIWSNEDVAVKEELKEDVLSNPGSPFQSSSLGNPPSSPYKIAEYHRLSPPECSQNQQYFYTTDADNNHLQTLVTLPPFPNISDSPTNQVSLDFPISTISLSEMSSSPDSSQVWVSANIDPVHDQPIKSRKRSNSGSSGSSANSCRASSGQSRPKIRRRQPLSQEEIERSRDTANKRERQRTESLNEAFSKLRGIVPTQPSDKLSKRETLKLAHMYIDFLNMVLECQDKYENGGLDCFSPREDLIQAFNIWRMSQHSK